MAVDKNILETKDLKKHFGNVRAVDEVNFEIKENVVTSIVGPNGAGKTTLFNLITGMLKPDSGTITFYGEDVTDYSPREIVDAGIVRSFQMVNLFERINLIDNLTVSIASNLGISTSMFQNARENGQIQEVLDEVISEFEIGGKEEMWSSSLPHGDRKLLDIALAYVHKPELLLLDEPTSGVGEAEKHRVMDILEKISETTGTTVCFIEHDLDVVRELSERVYVMHEGKILAEGEIEKVFQKEEVIEKYLGG